MVLSEGKSIPNAYGRGVYEQVNVGLTHFERTFSPLGIIHTYCYSKRLLLMQLSPKGQLSESVPMCEKL